MREAMQSEQMKKKKKIARTDYNTKLRLVKTTNLFSHSFDPFKRISKHSDNKRSINNRFANTFILKPVFVPFQPPLDVNCMIKTFT